MEIDVEAIDTGNTGDSETSFEQKDVLKQLNFDCIDLGADESSSPDSDDHLVGSVIMTPPPHTHTWFESTVLFFFHFRARNLFMSH